MEDGWIEWAGGECPVPADTLVDFRCRDGYEDAAEAGELATTWDADWWNHTQERESFNCQKDCRLDDIIAYRIAPQVVDAK